MEGRFLGSLIRNNSQIRRDRADAIAEDAETCYRRKVEDLQAELRKVKRDRENMLDLSPTNAQSLVLASDFQSGAFVDKDLQLGAKIRELEILLEIAQARYSELFKQTEE